MILCHYGDTNDVFHVGGLVDIDETPMEPEHAIAVNKLTLCNDLIDLVCSKLLMVLKISSPFEFHCIS